MCGRIPFNLTLITGLLLFVFTSFGQSSISFVDAFEEQISGVKVRVHSTENELLFQAYSNGTGTLHLPDEIPQHHAKIRIQARMFGYDPIDTTFTLPSEIRIVMESEISEQDEVIVTAQYGRKSAEHSVHRIKVIDRAKMDAMGAVNLRDVLTNEMGVRLAQDNVLGSSMSLQGISGENVKIMIDGVPVVGRLDGSIDVSQINLNDIERIEIVEGPLSVNYGTNALAGVINLISKKPTRNQLKTTATGYYESIGHYNTHLDVDVGGKKHSYGLAVGRNFFDGWNTTHATFKNPEPIADERRSMLWNPKEQLFGNAYYQFVKSNWNIRYKFDFFDETVLNRGLPRQPYFTTAFDDVYHTRRIDNALMIKRRFGTYGKLNTLFSYNRYDREKNTYFVDLTTLDQQLTASESDQDTSMFDQWVFRGSYTQNNDSSIVSYQVGYDVLIESAVGARIVDKRQMQGDFALFSTAEIRAGKRLIFRPGLRYAYNTTYQAPLLPSLNVKWNLFKNLDVRASYARGFRAPGIKELYFEFIDINHNIVGNDALNAERSHNISTALQHRLKKNNWNLRSELMGFYNTITNRISLAATDAVQFSYVNIGTFQSTGARASFQFQKDEFRLTSALGWIGTASDVLSENLRDEFLFYPEVQGSAMYSFLKFKTSIALFYKYQGQLPRFLLDEDGNVSQGITDDFHTLDVSASQKLWKEHIHLTIGVKNLFNVTNITTTNGNDGGAHSIGNNSISVGAGRSYFASLQFQLNHKHKSKR